MYEWGNWWPTLRGSLTGPTDIEEGGRGLRPTSAWRFGWSFALSLAQSLWKNPWTTFLWVLGLGHRKPWTLDGCGDRPLLSTQDIYLPHFLSPHSCQSLCHKRMQSPHLGDLKKMEVLDGWNSAISKRYLEQLPHRSSPKDPSCCRIKTFIGTVTFWSDVLDQVDAVTRSWNAMKLEVMALRSDAN